jgi:hypothetical protein
MTREQRRRRLYARTPHRFGARYIPRRLRREWQAKEDARKGA